MLKTHAQCRLEDENSWKEKTRAHLPLGPELSLRPSWKQEADLDPLHVGQPPWHRTAGRREENGSGKAENIQHRRSDHYQLHSSVSKCFPKWLSKSHSH